MNDGLRERHRFWMIVSLAVVAGLLLGPADLLAQRVLPYPWANLANSSAVWAVGAFGMGSRVRAGRWRPTIAGVVLLIVAVEAYYVAATLIQGDRLSNLWASSTLVWLSFAVLAGVIFGTAGGWARGENPWLRVVGAALPGAVLLAEAAVLIYRSQNQDAAYRTDSLQTAVIQAALGIVLPLFVGRTTRHRLGGMALSVPLALVGFGGFVLAGFGS